MRQANPRTHVRVCSRNNKQKSKIQRSPDRKRIEQLFLRIKKRWLILHRMFVCCATDVEHFGAHVTAVIMRAHFCGHTSFWKVAGSERCSVVSGGSLFRIGGTARKFEVPSNSFITSCVRTAAVQIIASPLLTTRLHDAEIRAISIRELLCKLQYERPLWIKRV